MDESQTIKHASITTSSAERDMTATNVMTNSDRPVNSLQENESKSTSDNDNTNNEDDIVLQTISTGGIYSVTHEVRVRSSQKKLDLYNAMFPFGGLYAGVKNRVRLIPYGCRFFLECFSTSPFFMGVFLLVKLWGSLRSALTLLLTERLMKIIQDGITSHRIDGRALFLVLVLRLLSIVLESFVTSKSEQLRMILRRKIRYVILGRMINTNMTFDLPAYEDSKYIDETDHYYAQYQWYDDIWGQFEKIVDIGSGITGIFSQVSFLYYLLRTQPGGVWFITVSAIQPLSRNTFFHGSGLAACAWDSNPFYRRIRIIMRVLHAKGFRLEIISLGLRDYIIKEWENAIEGLGDASEFMPINALGDSVDIDDSFIKLLKTNVMISLPMAFYSYQVYLNPKAFSLASIALVDQATMMIDQILESIFGARQSGPIDFEWMKSLYEGVPDSRALAEGEIVYSSSKNESSSNGMTVKFENVSFTYNKGKEPVLKDISFTIQKGQTVVIVGPNGSGKSTLLKLINRIYDVSSGTIYVDDVPLKSYVSSSVQRAMAILFQTFNHFPVSFAENIFLGCVDSSPSGNKPDTSTTLTYLDEDIRKAIKKAAELGGSTELINKQSKGFDTVLHPVISMEYKNYETASQKMKDFIKELQNFGADMSLGQWQRLALSRLFYRAAMKRIKLVAADEPSASLDPQIEYQIFSRLYDLSSKLGKTLIYVTHRFGYLTKRADLILVMKDGKLVEQGRHADLLALNGEYAKLYKVQAEAFLFDPVEKNTDTASTVTPEGDTLSVSSHAGSEEN